MPRISRWQVVFGAVLIQLCLGAIYAWSVFTPALKDAGWSGLETQFVFALGLAMFALVMVAMIEGTGLGPTTSSSPLR